MNQMYLLEVDNGCEYDFSMTATVGVFSTREAADNYIETHPITEEIAKELFISGTFSISRMFYYGGFVDVLG